VPEVKIDAESRSQFGKGAARRLRREGKVPAVVYGHGSDPRHVALPGHELMLALKTPNVLLEINIDGSDELTLPKSVQRDPVRYTLEHVDLVLVRRGEKVVVEVPLHPVGTPEPGGLLESVQSTLKIEAEATHIPQSIDVSIAGLPVGGSVVAGQIELPEGIALAEEPDALVFHYGAQTVAAEPDAAAAETEESAEAAAPSED
jgi:large subunit ribosomal protein L25